jgi:glutathione S-transferase
LVVEQRQSQLVYIYHARNTNIIQVQTGSFILRVLSFPNYDALLPASVISALESKAPAFWKWANAVVKEQSVTYIWNEKVVAERTQTRFAAAAK